MDSNNDKGKQLAIPPVYNNNNTSDNNNNNDNDNDSDNDNNKRVKISTALFKIIENCAKHCENKPLPPFSLIRDFRKQNTHGNVSEISVNHTCYRQIGSKSTNRSPLA